MKLLTTILPLAAISSAFVIPDEELTNQIVIESQKAQKEPTFLDRIQGGIENVWSEVEDTFKDSVAFAENALDSAINAAKDVADHEVKDLYECPMSMTKFDTQSWLESAESTVEDFDFEDYLPVDRPHKKPKHPKHGHHGHHKPNKTVYELIAGSKYTTKLAALINEYPDLVETLNGTAANYTVFAPTDKAFEKIPDDKKPSKEIIKKILAYHVSPEFYPAGRVLVTHTIPTALGEDSLGGNPQRLRVGLGLFKGLNINFYSKVIAINIFGTNGVIHGVDSLILPPPKALKIIELLPGEFSTLQLGLQKSGLFDKDAEHEGGTLFAPSNWAFKKLGPKINAFLFSKYGEKYLKKLLEYHVVPSSTLYSDAYYPQTSSKDVSESDIPKGRFHVDLPTLLNDKSLSIDIARFGGIITIKINGFNSISVVDGIAKDGVIHVLTSILIPPKTPGGAFEEADGEMDLEDFKERLIPTSEEL